MMRAAFPDAVLSVEELIAEGDKVAVRADFTGTHRGEFMGLPASGNRVTATGISFYTVVDSKITEHWEQFDAMGLMEQLGANPSQ